MQQCDMRGEPARPSVVMLKNDNAAAVKNINKPGKKPQMVEPQIPMIKEAFARNLIIQAEHCGKYYMDILSNVDYNGRKQLHHGEFMLRQQLVEDVLAALRTEADIDLFATRATKRRPQYVSRHPERIEDGAVACNALLLDWEEHPALKGKTLYAFPPPILLTDLAPMLEQADVQLVLIAPLWETTGPFWPTIQHRIHSYAVIPPTTRTYQHPHGTAIPRSRMPSWPLIAVRFCSQAALTGESQQVTLVHPRSFCTVRQHSRQTCPTGARQQSCCVCAESARASRDAFSSGGAFLCGADEALPLRRWGWVGGGGSSSLLLSLRARLAARRAWAPLFCFSRLRRGSAKRRAFAKQGMVGCAWQAQIKSCGNSAGRLTAWRQPSCERGRGDATSAERADAAMQFIAGGQIIKPMHCVNVACTSSRSTHKQARSRFTFWWQVTCLRRWFAALVHVSRTWQDSFPALASRSSESAWAAGRLRTSRHSIHVTALPTHAHATLCGESACSALANADWLHCVVFSAETPLARITVDVQRMAALNVQLIHLRMEASAFTARTWVGLVHSRSRKNPRFLLYNGARCTSVASK